MAATRPDKIVAGQVQFQTFCLLLEKISNLRRKERKKELFARFLEQWRRTHRKVNGDDVPEGDTFFPAMRLLLPSLDKERPSYGMKETGLANYYVDVLNIAKESEDGRKLLNYRAPSSVKHAAGDFATVAYLVLKDRCPIHGSLTIQNINTYLDAIAQANVEKKRDVLKTQIQKVIRCTSATEQKWFIRIILKELKIGLSENSVFSVFHPDALELYNVCTSLSKVCLDLHNPQTSISEAEIELFLPFRPMLGDRAKVSEVEMLMDHQPFFIETKIDGERMQLHKKGEEYRYFSRGCHDYSESFGRTVFKGTLTPHLASVFPPCVKSCILDGEMIAYDPCRDVFVSKGEHVDIKSDLLHGVHPCYVVFDILMLNDEKLASIPLKERIEKIKCAFKPAPGRFQFVTRKEGASKVDVLASLNDAIDNREEGLVIKSPNSLYKPSRRRGSGWLKIKPDYIDSLMDQLDVLIVGGYYGVGHRGGIISHFLCAIAAPQKSTEEFPSVFYSFCKVGSGYSLKELRDLVEQLNPHWRKYDTNKPPKNLVLAPGFKEKPDLWIEPSKSKILQIKAAEITRSEKYKCGFTLRFPRVEKIRNDKNWYDCMNLEEVRRLIEVSGGRLANLNIHEDARLEPIKKKRQNVSRGEKSRKIAKHLKGADVSTITELSKILEDYEFCIVTGSSEVSKHDLERKIAQHSGKFVQNPGSDTYCVIAEQVNIRIKNIIRQGVHDVVSVFWLLSCLEIGEVLKYKPRDMLFTSEKTKERFLLDYDQYGDSYMEDADEANLQGIFSEINGKTNLTADNENIAECEFRYFPNDSPLGIFRRCRAYFDKWKIIGDATSEQDAYALDLVQLKFRFHGGKHSPVLDENVTHVVLDASNTSRLSMIRAMIGKISRKAHIVTEDWVSMCIEKNYLIEDRFFEPL